MSTAAMNGADGVKTSASPANAAAGGSRQQFKSSNAGKALDGARKQNGSPVDGQNKRQQQPPQPKAWQGPNPITQRASSGLSNGTEKPLPKLPPQAQATSKTEMNGDKHAHDRLLFMAANMMGLDATVILKTGEQFTGVFAGGYFDSPAKSQYMLKMVRQTRTPGEAHVNGDSDVTEEYVGVGDDHAMSFNVQDTVSLAVDEVVTASTQPTQNGSTASTFRTDTEISGREPAMARERELQRWDAGPDESIDMSLDAGGTGWDQFATNERMYGVQSTYDENIYTTAIDRSDPRYRQREAEAARIAREIEGSTTNNAHATEERRRDAAQENGLDEEDKYSGVRREPSVPLPKRAMNAYIPPYQRPITGVPTVPGAPFDPAIISTAKPTQLPTEAAVPVAPASAIEPSTSTERPRLVVPESASRDTSVPAITAPTPKSQADQNTQDHISKTVDAFKQFANMEKLKVRQAQEQKRAQGRQEKNVKLNDLKKFAMNFKLNSRVPDDLVPILAKDREKQLEIQRRADDAANNAEVKAVERKKSISTPGATPPAPSSATSQAGTTPASEQRLPFNQHSRARPSQQMRGAPPSAGQTQSPRGQMNQGRNNQQYGRGGNPPVQPLADIRIPSGPAVPADRTPLSPASATRFNINAMEFRPTASTFTPSGTTPSPQRKTSKAEPVEEASADFFGKTKKRLDTADRVDAESTCNVVQTMLKAEYKDQEKELASKYGGILPPFRTQPTWPGVEGTSYKDTFAKTYPPSQGPSPLHTPNTNGPPMAHAHQLPPHMQGPQMSTPSQRQQQYYQQTQPPHAPAGFDPRMQQFGPNGSVQNSPRFPPAQMAYGQMTPQMQMQMPHFAGQQMHAPYGMSPSMQPRQVAGMPPGAPGMMMPGMPGQQFGQMPQGHRVFPPGPQFGGQPMGGQMIVPNPSNGGYNGPMPQQQGYSPMPHHPQPHMQQHPGSHSTPGPAGYSSSPRPPMMSHSGSQQGYNSQMHGMPQGGGMQPGFPPGQGQPHPMHQHPQAQWQRQLSGSGGHTGGGYPQQTPRQQHAMPMNMQQQHQQQHGSPGMGGGPGMQQGDEVKGG